MAIEPQSEPVSSSPRRLFPEAFTVLEEAIQQRAFPGCAFGLLRAGEPTISGALGRFTYEADSPEVSPETPYDIASLTKVVVTTAVAMLLYQRGRLELDTPVGELLPGFVVGREASEHARRVTVRHLLAHSSGLPGYVPLFHTSQTPNEVLRASLQLPIEAEPGTRAEYSDHGFILLGKALEAVVREPLPAFAHREIFAPMGMDRTGYCPPRSMAQLIPPTEEDELWRQRRIQGEVQDEHAFLMRGVAGHAGLFSNVPDLLIFAGAILDRAANSLFARQTVDLFAQRQGPPGSSRTLGWDTPSSPSSSGSYFSAQSIGHLGYSGCSLWIDLDDQLAVILLTNRTWPHRQSQAIREVRPKFHDALRKGL